MAEYSKKEFADLCALKTKDIATYAQPNRRKVIYNDAGKIDTTDPVNAAFLANRLARGANAAPAIPVVKAPKKEVISRSELSEDDLSGDVATLLESLKPGEIMSIELSDKIYQHSRALRTQRLAELAQIEIDKQMGVLVDFQSMKTLVSEYSRTITNSYKNALENLMSLISAKFSIGSADSASLRKETIDAINRANDQAIEDARAAMKIIIEQTAAA